MVNRPHDPIKVYSIIRFFSSLLFSVIVTVNLVYQVTVVGLNPLQLILVGTMLETISFLFEIPTGIVADVYSRKLSVIIGLILIGLGFTIEGLFPTFSAILLAQIVWGIGFTFVSGAREAWIADEVGEENAGKAFSKGTQVGLIGSFIGIGISMFLANINIRLPIVLGGLLYSCQSIYLWFFMSESNFSKTPMQKRETFGVVKQTLISGIQLIRLNPTLLTIIITGLIFGMFSEGFDRLWTPFIVNNFSFPVLWNLKPIIWFGILAMVANILAIIAVQFIEKNTDTNNHKSTVKSLLIINIFLVLSVLIFGLSGNFMVAIIGYWMITIFREARGPIYDAWTNQNLEPKIRATVFSMCSQANAVGQIVGGPILGLIATYISLRYSLILAAIFLIPTLFMYSNSIKKHKLEI